MGKVTQAVITLEDPVQDEIVSTGELPMLFRLIFADFPEVVELSDGDAELTDPNLDHRH